jgi:hypothetical protein
MAQFSDFRKQRDAARQQATALTTRLKEARRALDVALRQGQTAHADAQKHIIATLTAQRRTALKQAQTATEQLDALRTSSLPAATGDPLGTIDANLPIVFFPVRLETRFQGATLLVRVYPDDVHIDAHEPELTDDELRRGRDFWQQLAAGTDQKDAWADLARFHGSERAEWIAKQTRGGANPPARESSWTRPARAVLLPDRWIVLGYNDAGRVVTAVGSPIPDQLAAGPSPDDDIPAPVPGGTDALAAIDPEMRWLFDFKVAVAAGMALSVALPPAAQAGLKTLIVFGIKGTMDGAESADALARLLEAHRYTNGFSFLERGTPTNNTANTSSAYSSKTAPGDAGPFARPAQGAAADAVARALGVPAAVFANALHLDDAAESIAAAMNTALWPAAWGYFLDHRLAGITTDAGLDQIRGHFIDFVRGTGPLSPLRIGKEPYGLLPVTALDLWSPVDASDVTDRAVTILRNLHDPFNRAIANVPRLGATADPDQDLLSVLRMDANSSRHSVRFLLGPLYATNFWNFMGEPLDAKWWSGQATGAMSTLNVPGLPRNTPQATSLFSGATSFLGDKPLVDDGSGTGYIQALAGANLQTLRANTTVAAGHRTLLYDVVRHSLLTAYAQEARRIQTSAGVAVDHPEPELIGIEADDSTKTIWSQMDRPVASVTGAVTLGNYLDTPGRSAVLDDLRKRLQFLAQESADAIELHFSAALDTASHRWDAWATSLATRRLATLRKSQPAGVRIGGYGWVENLVPGSATASEGYIHAPSPVHAITAAILASGYLTHRSQAAGNPFAVDLSSERVKVASRLIDGVRHGQPLAALLGYDLERALHDARLSRYVASFRALAPLAAGSTPNQQTSEAIAANNVVHGERILTLWKTKDPRFQALRTSANIADFVAIDALLTRLDGMVDALGDMLVANSVHQVAEGNFNRTGLTLDAVLRGEPVPEQEVIHAPRSGSSLSHRVFEFLDANPAPHAAGWTTNPLQVRAQAEPIVNAWAARRLPDPSRVTCVVKDAAGTPRTVALADLGLSPLDAVFATEDELRQRIAHQLNAGQTSVIDFTASDDVSFDDLLAITTSIRALLARARPLTAAELTGPDDPGAPGLDLAELHARVENTIARLRSLLGAVQAGDPASLLSAAHFGFADAVPQADRVAIQLRAAEAGIAARLAQVTDLTAKFDASSASPTATLDYERERMSTLLGSGFPAVPSFTATNAAELGVAFGASDALLLNRRIEAVNWFTRLSYVRDGMSITADVLRFTELYAGTIPAFTVGQLPCVAGESWVALPQKPGTQRRGQVSLFVVGMPPAFHTPVAGLIFDEWHETIPSAKETTGLAFHFDRSNSRAPHAILLAVAPDVTRPWNLLFVEQLLREAFQLAKVRLVDQDAMTELDHYLPALTFAMNAAGDTVSSDLRIR